LYAAAFEKVLIKNSAAIEAYTAVKTNHDAALAEYAYYRDNVTSRQ